MSKSSDNPAFDPSDQAGVRALHDLCARLRDDALTADEFAQFQDFLRDSEAARTIYLRYVELHVVLQTSAGKHDRVEVEALNQRIISHACSNVADSQRADSSGLARRHGDVSPGNASRSRASWIVAATLLIAAALGFAVLRFSKHEMFPPHDEGRIASPTPSKSIRTTQPPAARLSFVSHDAVWMDRAMLQSSAEIRVGQRLILAKGEVELTYASGTKVLLIGPADFFVGETGGKLRLGGMMASVTEEGHGFTIDTPNGKVVDLGTEFGVVVDDFGVSEVSVFQGKVEAFPHGDHPGSDRIELTKGHGIQWNDNGLIALDADIKRFAASVLGRQNECTGSALKPTLMDEFQSAVLDVTRWKALGDVRPTPRGVELIGKGAASQPYLIALDQFDPSEGPVTVTCDFRFVNVGADRSPALSLLTRGADVRGTAPRPWSGTLASGVRCSFGAGNESGEGVLEAGVKLESDREMGSISWRGFLPPVADTPYRVVMRDDGTNVSFTMSLRDDPNVSKTVTCRSLFRGESNFVAIEGAASGTTLVERLEVAREHSPAPILSYSDYSASRSSARRQQAMEAQILSTLVPVDANLVLSDDFNDNTLDDSHWKTLGKVVVAGGAVQLGIPNAEQHIDTWHPRPYLLTAKPLDSALGALTIVGSIRFADNFLKGYGASFAVMSRADDQRGQGPGWEHSVLTRGVRANFWPSAWDLEHSLEIHEKPARNTISLLATQGVVVDPQVKSYLFKVVDDGRAVELTIIDPRHPDDVCKISAPTSSTRTRGFVGFESCWGSPVTLDNVRVFQRRAPIDAPPTPAKEG